LKLFFKLFLFVIILFELSYATPSRYFTNKYNIAKKNYLSSVMKDNSTKELYYLKRLIKFGKKIDINTRLYERELKRIDQQKKPKSQKAKKPKKKIVKKRIKHIYPLKELFGHTNKILTIPQIDRYAKDNKSLTNNKKYNLHPKNDKKYTIKSVYTKDNTIIINFNKRISRSYLSYEKLKNRRNYSVSFYIKGAFKDAKPTKLKINGIDGIFISQYQTNKLKILLKNKKRLRTVYIINKKQIIIKVLNLKTKIVAKTKVRLMKNNIFYPSKKVIVIDAGHGGKDSGAVGSRKMYEKNIVLNVARYLKVELNKKGYKVYLTRNRDKYIKLSYRTRYANKKHADIFVSIHANAARRARAKKAFGIETYFLSPARSKRAKRVAAKENKGDMKNMSWSSKNSLLTVLNRAKITASNKMAIDIQRNMLFKLRAKYGKSNIRDGGVREGPFWVLVGTQMPSVLIEIGYLSHPKEGRRIFTSSYQKRIAIGIANGIQSYFIKN